MIRDEEGNEIYQGFAEDITAQKQVEAERDTLEGQLRQAQKMEAVGQLTAGIAHNFNNMLQGITGNIYLTMLDAPDDLRPLLEEAQSAADRAAAMVRQLMVFARQGVRSERRPVPLAAIVRNAVEICRETFDRKIDIVDEIPEKDALVLGDVGQLEQVFMNLLINARDAVEEVDREPVICVRGERVVLEKDADQSVPPGEYVCVRVEDNGAGMDEETRKRVFDPFFTTKPVDRGTGLGLSTVYGIVQQHGGGIDCDSKPEAGARFSVYLPVMDPGPESGREMTGGAVASKTGTILVIDDEEMVRHSTARILERCGYDVLLAADGEDGLEVFRREPVDLVLLDLSMPRVSGREVLAEWCRLNPDVKVVIFTGYPARTEDFAAARAVVQKPFSMESLTRAVRQVLDA